jgi:hypothetical protein
VFLNISTDGGRTFAEPVNISSSQGQSVSPAIAVDPSGRVLLFWKDDVGGAAQIFSAVVRQ